MTINKVSGSKVRFILDLFEKSLSFHNYIFLTMILSASYSTLRGLVSRGCMLTLNQLKDFLYKFQGHITYHLMIFSSNLRLKH